LELLGLEDISLATLPKVIANIPWVYQPQKRLNHAQESYYDDQVGIYKPLIDPKVLVRASIAQEPHFLPRMVSKFRANALGSFRPTSKDRQEATDQMATGVQAIELPREGGVTTTAISGNSQYAPTQQNTVGYNDSPPPYPYPTGDMNAYTDSPISKIKDVFGKL